MSLIRALLKRFVGWLVLSLPVAVAAGIPISIFYGQDGTLDRYTSGFNGAVAGAWLGVLGALSASIVTVLTRDRLRAAGGSEILTGALVSYGLISIGFALLLLA